MIQTSAMGHLAPSTPQHLRKVHGRALLPCPDIRTQTETSPVIQAAGLAPGVVVPEIAPVAPGMSFGPGANHGDREHKGVSGPCSKAATLLP